MSNRRKSIRISLVSIAHITPHGLQDRSDVIVRDLSTGGMGGYVDHPCQKGDVLSVKIKLITADNAVIVASLTACIAWIETLEDGKRYAIGLEFKEMERSNPKLYKHLKGLETMLLPSDASRSSD